jgi:DNA transformation protein
MSTRDETVQFICDKLEGSGNVLPRKMFGEYAIYLDGVLIALVCDNQLFMKPTEPGRAFASKAELAPPYPGAKDYLLIEERDIANGPWLAKLARMTLEALPPPKPKKKKVAKKKAAKNAANKKVVKKKTR